MTATPTGATPAHRKLDALLGRWHTRGRVRADSSEADIEVVGTDTYEWLPGGHFMIHRVDVRIGDDRVHNLEVIGYDPATDRYPTRFFDHEGNSGTYVADVSDEGIWTFSTEGARAELVIDSDGGRMTASWERRIEEGSWRPWMELELAMPDRPRTNPDTPGGTP